MPNAADINSDYLLSLTPNVQRAGQKQQQQQQKQQQQGAAAAGEATAAAAAVAAAGAAAATTAAAGAAATAAGARCNAVLTDAMATFLPRTMPHALMTTHSSEYV